jgi:DNA-binding NtrC family response regulator
MPLRLQAKLLRVLQERVFERVGSSQTIGVDVRVIATSNRDLPRSVGKNEFRQDLFFRLNVLPIHLPPLRDRLEDVPALTTHFVQQIVQRDGRQPLTFSDEAMAVMKSYPWPGNVRELQNICERAVVLCRAGMVAPELIRPWLGQGLVVLSGPATPIGRDLPMAEEPMSMMNGNGHGHAHGLNGNGHHMPSAFAEPKPMGLTFSSPAGAVAIDGRPLEDIEREAIVTTLKKHNGHRQKTALALGIGVRTLGLKLKKWKSQNLVEATL